MQSKPATLQDLGMATCVSFCMYNLHSIYKPFIRQLNYCIVAACGLAALAEVEARQVFVHLLTVGWTTGRQYASHHNVLHCDNCLTELRCFMWQA